MKRVLCLSLLFLLFPLLSMAQNAAGREKGFSGSESSSPVEKAVEGEERLHAQIPPPQKGLQQTMPVTPPPLQEPDSEWIESTLDSMSLDEKIGQMIMPLWTGSSSASSMVSNYDVGGFIFTRQDSSTIQNATNSLQQQSDVPLIFSIDCEAGAGARVNDATIFPMNMALASTRNEDLARQQGVVTARECRAMGIHIGFGPVLDVNTEPVNPIIGIRAYSDRPSLVEKMASSYVQGAESAGMLTTFKHYPGHGAAAGDSHESLPVVDISCDDLQEQHVRPYRTLLGEGVGDLVMTAHVWYPCLDPGENAWPATLSEAALHGILREDIGFDKVLISDSFGMRGLQLAASTYEGVQISVQAGLDIVLMPPSVSDAFNGIKDAVTSGQLTESRIDQSVRRILRLKSRVGLPESAIVPPEHANQTLQHPQHTALAEEIGKQAIAGTRVDEGVLPLEEEHEVLVLPFLTSSRIFYLFSHAPFTDELNALLPSITVREVGQSLSSSEQTDILSLAAGADRVVVTSRSWKPSNSRDQTDLLEDLLDEEPPLIYFSFGSPYHIKDIPGIRNYFSTFSSHYSSQREAARMLVGEGDAEGDWPVALFDDANQWNMY